ncbi:MAG: hypothetical protein C0596_05365 [Marinilabiliales bacterium]|nr:MAG: hypothetical protein C0596_05365 [Marinilabiliales bacterium]
MVSVSFAQKSNGGYPLSFLKVGLQEEIDEIVIDNPSIEDLRLEDSVREINNQLFRVGVRIPVEINIDNFGTWDLLEDGTRVWRLKITSYNAKSITLLYDSFNLTSGCELFLYNDNRKQLLGSFNYNTNHTETGKFSTQMIAGESTYLELNISPECIEMPTIDIEGIIYNYRSVDGFVNYYYDGKETGFGSSGDCNPNVNCPEGYDWQNEKKGIALIFVIDGFSAGFCSGSLINNTAFDGTPYFLTAEHCGGSVPAEDLAQWQFYFNYEAVDCEDPVTEPSY